MNVPTLREIHAAKQQLTAATLKVQKAQAVCDEHALIDPLQAAFTEGAAAGHMKTNPANHWKKFVEHFGEVEGAREQFDAGLAGVIAEK